MMMMMLMMMMMMMMLVMMVLVTMLMVMEMAPTWPAHSESDSDWPSPVSLVSSCPLAARAGADEVALRRMSLTWSRLRMMFDLWDAVISAVWHRMIFLSSGV
eukprot:8934444-Pyramimonas_sp.AAC.1